jgi:hypothetical protein
MIYSQYAFGVLSDAAERMLIQSDFLQTLRLFLRRARGRWTQWRLHQKMLIQRHFLQGLRQMRQTTGHRRFSQWIMVVTENPGVVTPDEPTSVTPDVASGVSARGNSSDTWARGFIAERWVACTTCQSPWPGDRWRASEPSFTPSENCVTFCLSECTSKRWCEPETRKGPDQIVTAYDTCTVADLKQVLRGRNLNSTGNKDVLIKKCQDFDKGIPQVLAGCSVATTQGSKPGGKRDRQPIPAETHGDAAHGPVVRELAAKVQVLDAKVEATWELQSQVMKLEAAVHELQAKIAPASMSSRASTS